MAPTGLASNRLPVFRQPVTTIHHSAFSDEDDEDIAAAAEAAADYSSL